MIKRSIEYELESGKFVVYLSIIPDKGRYPSMMVRVLADKMPPELDCNWFYRSNDVRLTIRFASEKDLREYIPMVMRLLREFEDQYLLIYSIAEIASGKEAL